MSARPLTSGCSRLLLLASRGDEAFTFEPAINCACSVQIKEFHQVRNCPLRLCRSSVLSASTHTSHAACGWLLFGRQRAGQSLAQRMDSQMSRRSSLPPLHQLFELGVCCLPAVLSPEQVHDAYNAIVAKSAQHSSSLCRTRRCRHGYDLQCWGCSVAHVLSLLCVLTASIRPSSASRRAGWRVS